MKSIGKRKQTFEEFREEIKNEIDGNQYLNKIFYYTKQLKEPVRPGTILNENDDSIEVMSKEWFYKLATSESLITTQGFGPSFIKRKEQTIHGLSKGCYGEDAIQKEIQIRTELQEGCQDIKKKKLLFTGNFNMDVGQLISLLAQLDYEMYDVTLIPLQVRRDDQRLSMIPPEVRLLTHYGRSAYTREEYEKFRYLSKYLFYADDIDGVLDRELGEFLERENQRLHGKMEFDEMVVFGEFLPMDYIFFSKIHAKKKIHIQTYDMERMKQNWRMGKYTGKYDEFAIKQRIQLMNYFDEIQCLSQGLLKKEQAIGTYPWYENAKFLEVRKDMTRWTEEEEPKILTYQGEEYFAYDIKEDEFGSQSMSLLPKVADTKRAWYYLVDDLSGNSFEPILQQFRDEVTKEDTDMLYVIDNFEVIDEIKEGAIQRQGLTKRVVVLRDIKFHPEYMKQFYN